MKISGFLVVISFFGTLALATAGDIQSTPSAASRSDPSAVKTSPTARAALEKGMTAQDIVGAIGKPAQVKRVESKEGPAEVWTYRRLVDQQVRQNAASVTMLPVFAGAMGGSEWGMTTAPSLNFHFENVKVYQVTSLLLFDGRLVVAKQWREQESSISQ